MTASARSVSRRANHIVTTTITQAEMVVMMKPADWAQAGCTPVSRGIKNSVAMTRAAETAARQLARKMCSVPSTSTTRQAPTMKKSCAPEPVPTSQQLAKTVTKAAMMNVSGATRSPKRCSVGMIANISAAQTLIETTCQSQVSISNCMLTKLTLTATANQEAMFSIRARRAALTA